MWIKNGVKFTAKFLSQVAQNPLVPKGLRNSPFPFSVALPPVLARTISTRVAQWRKRVTRLLPVSPGIEFEKNTICGLLFFSVVVVVVVFRVLLFPSLLKSEKKIPNYHVET